MYVRPPFFDDFSRPDGALLSPWRVVDGAPVLFSGGLTAVECGLAVLPFTGNNFAVSAVLSAKTSGTLSTLLLKSDNDAANGFSISVQDDLTLHIEATVAGVTSVIGRTDAIAVGDSFGLYHFTEDGIQKLRATSGIYTLAEIEVPEAFLSLQSGTNCGVWVSAGASLGEFLAEERPAIALPLVPLQKSWAANQLEQELKNLFVQLFDEMLSSQAEEIAVYGMPHLGPFSLIERLVTQDGLAVIRQGDEAGMRYLYEAWKFKNPKRGMHFLRTYLQVLFGSAWDVQQLWQEKAQQYPLSLKTAGQIALESGDLADYYLTSRIRVDLDTDIIPNNVIQSLRTALAARFVLEMRIAKFFESEWFLGSYATASALFDAAGVSKPPPKNAASEFTFVNLATASVVFYGVGETISKAVSDDSFRRITDDGEDRLTEDGEIRVYL